MPDAYLLNSYTYYKKRLELVGGSGFVNPYQLELAERVKALKAEIEKRKLI